MLKYGFMAWKVGLCLLSTFVLISCTKDPVAPASSGQPPVAQAPAVTDGAPVLVAVYPAATSAGKAFNKQPDGSSAMAVACTGNPVGVVIVFDDKPMSTVRGAGGCLFSTEIPAATIEKAGVHSVYLRSPGGDSNRKSFVVNP